LRYCVRTLFVLLVKLRGLTWLFVCTLYLQFNHLHLKVQQQCKFNVVGNVLVCLLFLSWFWGINIPAEFFWWCVYYRSLNFILTVVKTAFLKLCNCNGLVLEYFDLGNLNLIWVYKSTIPAKCSLNLLQDMYQSSVSCK